MSYQHDKYTVAKIEKHTQEFINRTANQVTTVNPDDPKPVLVDGIPLTPKCAAMVAEVKAFMPNTKIGLQGSGGDYDMNENGMRSVMVYREGDVYALGRVGFRDVAINGYKYHYFVHSRKIINQKAHCSRWQYNAKTSEDLKRMVKVAKQCLIPYTPTEMADLSIEEFAGVFSRDRRQTHVRTRQTFRDMVLGDENMVIEELRALFNSGHNFVKPAFAEKVAKYFAAEDAYKEHQAKRLDAYFMDIGPETTTVVEYDNLISEEGYIHSTKPRNTTTVRTEDIPFDLQLKLSSLQVAEPMHYVEDLGMRVGDRTFWVQR